jgi:pimeloyl-ACP methyl ester carboxylesterase
MSHGHVLVNGLRVEYTVEGRGPDVVLIHGWASSRRMWTLVTRGLAREFRCWALDLPGCGGSDKPGAGWYSIPSFTRLVGGFLRAHQLERPRVVGHSMGGMIALNLAADEPEAVERLVAINPVVTGLATLKPLARRRTSLAMLDLAVQWTPRVLEPLLAHPLGRGVRGMAHLRRRAEDFGRSTAEALLSSGQAVVSYDVSPLLPRIQAPTLVLLGRRDRQVPLREGRLAAGRIARARLQELEAGHQPTDDRPQEVVRHLRRFLM